MKKWSRQEVIDEAQRFDTRRQFQDGANRAYQAARKYGWLEDACSHMCYVRKSWTYDELRIVASKYKSRIEFVKGNNSAYQAAKSRGILDDICSHMKPIRMKWTYASILSEAIKYDTRNEFQKQSPNAYAAARRKDVMDEVCSHMGVGKGSDEDVVYIWRDTRNHKLVKIGITSSRLEERRIRECAKSAGMVPTILAYQSGLLPKQARELENILLKIGVPVDVGDLYGKTEFRIWTEDDLNSALSEISRYLQTHL